MASLERRPRRRRQQQVGQNVEDLGRDAQEMMDSVKNSDCVERLARKYMQKCVVESSTESESESSVEVLRNPLAEGLRKAGDSKGLQFLDPYDGDSEDTSVHSDCSLSSLNSAEAAPWLSSASKAVALEDTDPSGDGRSFPQPLDRLCSETEVPGQQKGSPGSLLQSSEPMRRTEAFPSTWLMPDPSTLVGVNPSARADLPAGAGGSSPRAMPADDCDGTASRPPLIKRKQGVSTAEGAAEKLRRKKIRAI